MPGWFYDAAGKLLNETNIEPVTPEDRGNQTAFLKRTASGSVPAGTRRVEVWVTMRFYDGGGYIDGYADNISFTLNSNAPTALIKDGGVVNAASGQTGPIAPGEIISIYGSGLGPANAVGMETSSTGQLLTTRAGVKVLVNDTAAPLLMVQAGQINAVVPFDVANTGDAKIVIDNNGSKSAAYGIGVANTAPAIFTADGSGKGQAYVLNQDFTANAASNAAAKGSTITIFCTGLGQTKPAGANGMFITSGALPAVANIGLKIGDQTATVQFAGAVPYGWPGLYQIIATVPPARPRATRCRS
ncbi:MAG: hypothetical protein M1541_21220 [Acidobacteria bacterium]|nr:hypothetical protein [Acidobacteriota bacterium]